MHVDESGRDDHATSIEHVRAARRQIRADRDDALALDAHVGVEARRAAAVDDGTAAQQDSGGLGVVCGWHRDLLRSEVGADRAGHAIAVVDREQDPPLVERRARMRNAAADQVADLRRVGFVAAEAEVRVLVVH